MWNLIISDGHYLTYLSFSSCSNMFRHALARGSQMDGSWKIHMSFNWQIWLGEIENVLSSDICWS